MSSTEMAATTDAGSSAQPTSTSQTASVGFVGSTGGTGNTSLYLFTFLITIVVLGTIAAGLLVRAYIVKRRFQRRVEEALREGRALTPDMALALGLIRPGNRNNKKEKKVGRMPVMWEAEMWRDEKAGGMGMGKGENGTKVMVEEVGRESQEDEEWDEMTPLSMLHFPPPEPPTGPQPIDLPLRPRLTGRDLIRALFRPDSTTTPMDQLREAALNRTLTRGTIIPNAPALEVPPEGTEVVMGVMISMPTEPNEQGEGERWYASTGEDDDEVRVPQVCLGVMGATIGR